MCHVCGVLVFVCDGVFRVYHILISTKRHARLVHLLVFSVVCVSYLDIALRKGTLSGLEACADFVCISVLPVRPISVLFDARTWGSIIVMRCSSDDIHSSTRDTALF